MASSGVQKAQGTRKNSIYYHHTGELCVKIEGWCDWWCRLCSVLGEKKNHLFRGKSSMRWSEACLKISIWLYSTGRDALSSVFHFVTVNSHQSGGLINLLLLKMPKHFGTQLTFFFLFVICTNHLGYNHIWHMTSSLVIIVKLLICSAWVITACQLVAADGFSQQFEQQYEGL